MFELGCDDLLAAHFDFDLHRRPHASSTDNRSAYWSIQPRSIVREIIHRVIAGVSDHGVNRLKIVHARQLLKVGHIFQFAIPEWLPHRETAIDATGKMHDEGRKIIGSL